MIVRDGLPDTPEWILPPREVVEDLSIGANIELGAE